MNQSEVNPLAALAKAHGLELAYEDAAGRRQEAKREVLLGALRGMGIEIASEAEAEERFRSFELEKWRRILEPVSVAWSEQAPELVLRLPESFPEKKLSVLLRMESGESLHFSVPLEDLPPLERREIAGEVFFRKNWRFPHSLPFGLHQGLLETPKLPWEFRLVCAPPTAYVPAESREKRSWGLFLPLYALPNRNGWGAGDFGDLEALLQWAKQRGGEAVSTLPFLATFLDQPCDPSPYSPVSRLFWNEFYLDIESIPELAASAEARALLNSPEFARQKEVGRAARLIDFRQQMALKREILERLQKQFFSGVSPRQSSFQEFLRTHPLSEDYARFRATAEQHRTPWQDWPAEMRAGRIDPGSYEEDNFRYHLYVQWQAESQVQALAQKARDQGVRLALDLPLGIHPQGYDAWRDRNLFANNVTVGAPPDAFFIRGQNWGFPPLLPEKSREEGHAYFLSALRRLLEPSGMLRIDHMMGLHRLFWIPNGFSASEGCYIRYPAEEFYALLCLESQRSQTVLVGEDLGTVPPEVRPAMARHHILRSHVAPFEFRDEPDSPLSVAPAESIACLNTHDMPTFAGFWQGQDLEDRRQLGLLDDTGQTQGLQERLAHLHRLEHFFRREGGMGNPSTRLDLLQACLVLLAKGPASWLLINLEDLWAEPLPQNVPGTSFERPNWRRKAQYSLLEFSRSPSILRILEAVDRARRENKFSGS